MKYLHFTENFILHELPFARGLQYQAAVIAMEGGEFNYISTYDEVKNEMEHLNSLLMIDDSFGE